MRPALQLDFVAPRRRGRALGVAVLAFCLGTAGAMVWKFNDTQARLRNLDAVQSLMPAQRAAPRAPREAEMKSAQAAVRQLALPWAQLIDSLERAATKEVALLHIQPDAQTRVLRLTAETRHQELMLEYMRRLAQTGRFAEVHLLSHQVREDEPGRPVQFSVQASFRDAR